MSNVKALNRAAKRIERAAKKARNPNALRSMQRQIKDAKRQWMMEVES